jgi:hypothetical protein
MRSLIAFALAFLLLNIVDVTAEPRLIDRGPDSPARGICGGFAGFRCQPNQYCDYPPTAACGIGDQTGTCRQRPDVCTREYMPVCGCNGETYPNACQAAAAGFDVAYPGTCRTFVPPKK